MLYFHDDNTTHAQARRRTTLVAVGHQYAICARLEKSPAFRLSRETPSTDDYRVFLHAQAY